MFTKNYGFQSEAAVDLSLIVKTFNVTRGYEGPQILLEWEFFNDADLVEFKVMKKEGAYPLSVNDGILTVLGNTSGVYGDLEINPGAVYYYTLFVKLAGEDKFVFDTVSMGKALAINTGYYQNVLWQLIPQIYRIRDEVQSTLQKTYIQR
jgi:hypothetical protein